MTEGREAWLDTELQTLKKHQAHLEQEHAGKFVLIHGHEVVNTFDSFENAAWEGRRQFGDGPFLIREIGINEIRLSPAVVYGLTRAHTQD